MIIKMNALIACNQGPILCFNGPLKFAPSFKIFPLEDVFTEFFIIFLK